MADGPPADMASQRIYAPNVIANSSLHSVKFLMSCFTGAAAGILGLQNTLGFLFFLISTLFGAGLLYAINCKGKPSKYVQGGLWELANPGQDNAFTFVLVWTLFYGKSSTAYSFLLLAPSLPLKMPCRFHALWSEDNSTEFRWNPQRAVKAVSQSLKDADSTKVLASW